MSYQLLSDDEIYNRYNTKIINSKFTKFELDDELNDLKIELANRLNESTNSHPDNLLDKMADRLRKKSTLTNFKEMNYEILIVEGDSMIDIGVNDGDRILYYKIDEFQESSIMVVQQNSTQKKFIKRIHIKGNNIILHSENSNYDDYIDSNNEFTPIGIVDYILKKVE